MFFNRNYINRAVAAILLLALIFIHGVKLLHTHSFNLLTANHSLVKSESVNTAHNSSYNFSADCEICNYHLAKDKDHFVIKTGINYIEPLIDYYPRLISFQKRFPFSSFENRGPPDNA